MTTIHQQLISPLLALTVLLTVGVESSHAQKGKLRGLMNSRSSNNGGSNSGNSNFNIGNVGSRFQSSNSNATQTFSGNLQTQQTTFGKFNNNASNQNNPLSGISSNNLPSQSGKFQQLFGRGKLGQQLSNDQSRTDQKFGKNLNGLQNVLNGISQQNGQGGGLDNFGKGNHSSKLLQLIQQNQKHGKICLGHNDWCHARPKTCHWWYHWCKPLAYCEPQHHVHCGWNYVTCDYVVNGHVVQPDARWYLGLKGLLLPGQGVGIEEVAPGSPAAAVGLQPGMVITACNGIELVDEAALGHVIAQSGGVLRMDLRLSADGPPATCVVVMTRVASVNY